MEDNMGKIEKQGKETVYKQDDGNITAWLTDFDEKMEIGHEGTPAYRIVFYIISLISVLYLGMIVFKTIIC